jgi:hypothetical protein
MRLAITILFSALAFAQKPAIEVESVKPNKFGDSVGNTMDGPQRARWNNTTLWILMLDVYRMKIFDGKNERDARLRTRMQVGLYEAYGVTVAQLVKRLSNFLHAPVEDATGLTGKYDFKLEWVETEKQLETRPSISTAIQSMGLKLDAVKTPIQMLVIDHVEKPMGN